MTEKLQSVQPQTTRIKINHTEAQEDHKNNQIFQPWLILNVTLGKNVCCFESPTTKARVCSSEFCKWFDKVSLIIININRFIYSIA